MSPSSIIYFHKTEILHNHFDDDDVSWIVIFNNGLKIIKRTNFIGGKDL